MFIEKRKFPRVNIPCKISCVFGERLLVFNNHTENLSATGMRVILEEKLSISTIVDIELLLLDREKHLKCKGQIVWTKEINPPETEPRIFDIGIKFIEINDSSQEELKKFVNALISKAHGDKE